MIQSQIASAVTDEGAGAVRLNDMLGGMFKVPLLCGMLPKAVPATIVYSGRNTERGEGQ